MLTVDEAAFRVLARDGALAVRREGGWRLIKPLAPPAPPPGRPGVIEGERVVIEGSDQHVVLRANLGESPLAWLARRGGLEPVEIMAGERLREDFQKAGTVGRLTMNWDAQPRGEAAAARPLEPALRARAAKDRIAAALAEVGPGSAGDAGAGVPGRDGPAGRRARAGPAEAGGQDGAEAGAAAAGDPLPDGLKEEEGTHTRSQRFADLAQASPRVCVPGWPLGSGLIWPSS
jgi:hypothetical protein